MLIFFTNVASNIIFMLFRSCSNSRIYSSSAKSNDEGIEKHQTLVSLCSAFLSPFVVTFSLIAFEFRWRRDDDSDGSS